MVRIFRESSDCVFVESTLRCLAIKAHAPYQKIYTQFIRPQSPENEANLPPNIQQQQIEKFLMVRKILGNFLRIEYIGTVMCNARILYVGLQSDSILF